VLNEKFCKDKGKTAYMDKGKAILVTNSGGQQGSVELSFPHFLDNRLTAGGKVVSLTYWPPFNGRFLVLKKKLTLIYVIYFVNDELTY
jgi:hypothetical protein